MQKDSDPVRRQCDERTKRQRYAACPLRVSFAGEPNRCRIICFRSEVGVGRDAHEGASLRGAEEGRNLRPVGYAKPGNRDRTGRIGERVRRRSTAGSKRDRVPFDLKRPERAAIKRQRRACLR